jgi:hypothetical protein
VPHTLSTSRSRSGPARTSASGSAKSVSTTITAKASPTFARSTEIYCSSWRRRCSATTLECAMPSYGSVSCVS